MRHYVLTGGNPVATIFGYWGKGSVPEGCFAVVHDGELTNGGTGPILSINTFFVDLGRASVEAERLNTPTLRTAV